MCYSQNKYRHRNKLMPVIIDQKAVSTFHSTNLGHDRGHGRVRGHYQ